MPEEQNIQMYEKLTEIADGVVSDIRGEFESADYGYDLWIEDLNGVTYGVIDMGDLYQGCYSWDGEGWEQFGTTEPHKLIDRIILKRTR